MAKRIGKVHLIIPDCQVGPDTPTEHLTWIGNYAAEKQPDVIVCLGDFADMTSLSSYDRGKIKAEGKRYEEDCEAAYYAMGKLMKPIHKAARKWAPELFLTLGNHEDRITRYVSENPSLEGKVSMDDLNYGEWGWTVAPFKRVIKIDGIEYVHYFVSGPKGMPIQKAVTILNKRHCSGVMGHIQKTDIAFHEGSGHIAIIAGCCYLHEEDYLGPQMEGKAQRRQIVMLHEVREGIADPMFVSLEFLRRKYA